MSYFSTLESHLQHKAGVWTRFSALVIKAPKGFRTVAHLGFLVSYASPSLSLATTVLISDLITISLMKMRYQNLMPDVASEVRLYAILVWPFHYSAVWLTDYPSPFPQAEEAVIIGGMELLDNQHTECRKGQDNPVYITDGCTDR